MKGKVVSKIIINYPLVTNLFHEHGVMNEYAVHFFVRDYSMQISQSMVMSSIDVTLVLRLLTELFARRTHL